MTARDACFQVPAWHSMLWSEYAEQAAEAPRVAAEGDKKVAGFSDGYLPELFHRLYAQEPATVDPRGRGAAARARLHDLAGELPEFQQLRRQTVQDPTWSGVATVAIGEQPNGR